MQTKETETPKFFIKDKAILKKEAKKSRETQFIQKSYKDANVQCNIESNQIRK